MNFRSSFVFSVILIVCNCCCVIACAQTPNPCGVAASIIPARADSVVPAGTLIAFSSANSTNATSIQWLLDGLPSGSTSTNWNYQITTGMHVISLVAYNGNCSDTSTVVYFAAGTYHNVDSLLMANYGTSRYNEEGTCIAPTPDSGYIAGGVQYPWDLCGEIGIIIKMRNRGCIDWSKELMSPYYCNYSKVTALSASSDSNYYAATENIELARLDKNGNLVWNNRYALNNASPIAIPNVYSDSMGYIYTISQAYNNGWCITKIDKTGAVVWNKFYRLSYDEPQPGATTQSEFAIPSSMVFLKNKIYVCGNAYSKADSSYFSFITKLDPATGAKEWQYGYTFQNYPGITGFVHLALYDTLLMASTGAQGQIVTLIDPQGTVKKSIKAKFASSYGPVVTRAGAANNGHIYMMQWTTESLPLQPYFWYATNFAEIDTSMNKYFGMVFAEYSRGYFADATMARNNKFGAVGNSYGFVTDGVYASRDIRFLSVDTVNNEQYCFTNSTNYTVTNEPVSRHNFQYLVDSSLSIIQQPGTPYIVTDAFAGSRYTCPDYIDSCSFMKISGPVSLCSLNDTYTYRLHRNKKCVLQPQWQLPSGVSIVNQTDSSLTVKFAGFGVYHIVATLNSCIPAKDSLIINIVSKSHPLNLGSDTTICAGSTITLHAAKDYFSYIWNDGSTDSVLTITQPGLYWVKVTDSCNNVLRDSITVTPFYLPISIGPDRTKCNTDTVQLHAPAGFINYTWSANYNISSTSQQNVVVNPPVDTAYYLKAEKLPGCFSYDTVRIFVKTSPPVLLGPDKSFCSGDSAVLNAGAGFVQYLWSNGAAAQKITVYTSGIYSVAGKAANGCTSYDTLRILNVWPNPLFKLDGKPDLCTGNPRTLSPGNYAAYLWQNGSTAPTFTVTGIGTYYVTVTDNNQCKGSDTVHIVRMLPAPANFLFADTAICSYGEITLIANQNFTSYLWSTGSFSPGITITQPGIYWLQATDNNNCRATDSVTVLLKECLKGLYVPTAFTPNKDGHNDIFKPMIFGNVAEFEWLIYDRYGQIIFKSVNPAAGWDGTIQGVLQNTGGFIWVCRYRFAGEATQVKKGSFVLLR